MLSGCCSKTFFPVSGQFNPLRCHKRLVWCDLNNVFAGRITSNQGRLSLIDTQRCLLRHARHRTIQQPPQRGGAVLDPVWVELK